MSQTQSTQIASNEGTPNTVPPFVAFTRFPQAEAFLEAHLGEAAPVRLPERWRHNLVRSYPWIALAFVPLDLALGAMLVGVTIFTALLGNVSVFSSVLCLAMLALHIMALPGLFKRQRRGWTYFVYGLVPMAINGLLDVSLFGLAVVLALAFGAFQVKYRYE